MSEVKMIQSELPESMEGSAVSYAKDAMKLKTTESEMAKHIKTKMDKAFGKHWHCVVGKNFGSYVTHDPGNYVFFYVDKMAFQISRFG
ncbi:hypothetical protein CRM22_005093 [Opisthorchis felineus]|uniref:Dynein light chain n=1 Tax=Opisthorchis felineus TaxID=147828 RepID=A0A4S2LSR8_OPIFE|nr:hypothetical protein CRM22_005093 [Opisthorchis felineus]